MVKQKTMLDWSQAEVQRFWDWCGANPYLQQHYFTYKVGGGITAFLSMTGRLQGKLLDYGCGTGYLLAHLLEKKLEGYAVDLSPDSVQVVNAKFANHPYWRGAQAISGPTTPYPNAYFDVITCVETVEHLPDELITPIFSELHRLLKPGGLLMITTPYAENLAESMTYCPFCDSEFHKWQHMRSVTPEFMRTRLQEIGFQVDFCQNMDFHYFQRKFDLSPYYHISPARLYLWLAFHGRQILDKWSPRPFPYGREIAFRLKKSQGNHLCTLATVVNG